MSLRKELQRRCDLPECDKRAQDVKCRQCDVATYCSEEHRSAHESRCDELCKYLRLKRNVVTSPAHMSFCKRGKEAQR
jgi:hypothetical protein